MTEDYLRGLVEAITRDADRSEWDLDALAAEVIKVFPLPQSEDPESWRRMNAGELAEHLVALSEEAYDAKEAAQGADLMRQLERLVMLRAVDNRWVRHLTDLDELREGIGLRAFAQQDPLIAYARRADVRRADRVHLGDG
jgi:preprotein translocase subunit SecA